MKRSAGSPRKSRASYSYRIQGPSKTVANWRSRSVRRIPVPNIPQRLLIERSLLKPTATSASVSVSMSSRVGTWRAGSRVGAENGKASPSRLVFSLSRKYMRLSRVPSSPNSRIHVTPRSSVSCSVWRSSRSSRLSEWSTFSTVRSDRSGVYSSRSSISLAASIRVWVLKMRSVRTGRPMCFSPMASNRRPKSNRRTVAMTDVPSCRPLGPS